MPPGPRPDPLTRATAIRRLWQAEGAVRLLFDTNVYIDAREAIGYGPDGRLLAPPAAAPPPLAVLQATSIIGLPVIALLDQWVQNELFNCLRNGYDSCPVGLPPGDAAKAMRDLLELHDQLPSALPERAPAPLPDPPLPSTEQHDRRIWAQADFANATLITSDSALLEAIWEHVGAVDRALRPEELVAVATA